MTRDAIKEFSVKSVHCCTRNLKDLNDESSHQREETRERERERAAVLSSQLTKLNATFTTEGYKKNDVHELHPGLREYPCITCSQGF